MLIFRQLAPFGDDPGKQTIKKCQIQIRKRPEKENGFKFLFSGRFF